MPTSEYYLMVLCVLLYIKDSLGLQTLGVNDASIFDDIMREDGYTPRNKRPSVMDLINVDFPQDCCPTVTRAIAPLGGISKEGSLLQLFRDPHTIQKFYETSCAPNIENQPCGFIDRTQWASKCRQKYTFTYAIVKDFNLTEPYRIDYMRIKSGCSCSVFGNSREVAADQLVSEMIQIIGENPNFN